MKKKPVRLTRFMEILVLYKCYCTRQQKKCESLLKLRFVLALNLEFSIQYYDYVITVSCHF